MGRFKSMKWQAWMALDKQKAYGQSKHIDKMFNGGKPAPDKIYSHKTMENYKGITARFATWAEKTHGCKTLAQAEQYAGEWIGTQMDNGLKPATIHQYTAAVAKVYQKPMKDVQATIPSRPRSDTTQYRGKKWVGHFSPEKHSDLVDFYKDTGLRRHEIAALRPSDVTRLTDGRAQVTVRQGKGGKKRVVTALSGRPADIAEKAAAAGRGKVFDHIPKYAPIHEEGRQHYAQTLYDSLARDVSTLPRSERYHCRGDKAGTVYDRAAMKVVTEQLGHSRISVIAQSYLK